MRRCTVFALPSVYEGLGCVYLEAMACAKPVIGCYEQGIDEVIQDGETGILVPPEDESRLSEAILSLLRNRHLCQKVGSRARELIVSRFGVRQQGQQIADVYHRCTS
jgi:glycosyltransferase involved in cell wall biosynthesis